MMDICDTARSSPAFAVGGAEPKFLCFIGGEEISGYHFLLPRGICPAHCSDHDFQYSAEFREHRCQRCDEPAPADWYDGD